MKYAMARDVRIEDVEVMMEKLGNWASTTKLLLATLDVSSSLFERPAPLGITAIGPPEILRVERA